MAKLVREALPPPAPIPQPVAEEEIPEPEPEEPEVPEELPDEIVPEQTEQPKVAAAEEPDIKEQVKSKGLLAFRDSFANRSSLRPTAQLGSQARLSTAGEDKVGRPTRSMVTTNAPHTKPTTAESAAQPAIWGRRCMATPIPSPTEVDSPRTALSAQAVRPTLKNTSV